MKAIVDDKIPFIRGQIEQLVDEVTYMPGSTISALDVSDADILIVRTRTRCNQSLLEGSSVKLIVTATIGFDHVDTDYCTSHGIEWTNCPGCNAHSVCCYVMNAIEAMDANHGPTTIGIVGVGHVGTEVAIAARKQGMHLLLCDPLRQQRDERFEPYIPFVSLNQIAAEADIITFHTPLTTEGLYPTYHLADTAFFSHLKRQPIIINASRGAVVDNSALFRALQTGQVQDAVIDTWEGEPLNINTHLLQRVSIGTPHIAGYSVNGKANATRMTLNYVARFLGIPFEPHIEIPTAEKLSVDTLLSDSVNLKHNPSLFEALRERYPIRCE